MDAEQKARLVALQHRIEDAQHRIEAGAGMEMALSMQNASTPKHLRTGVDSALVFNGALIALLIEKGVFTQEEYYTVAAGMMEEEVRRYETRISAHLGRPAKL